MNTLSAASQFLGPRHIGAARWPSSGLHPGRFSCFWGDAGGLRTGQTLVEQALRFEPDVVVARDPSPPRQARTALGVPVRRLGRIASSNPQRCRDLGTTYRLSWPRSSEAAGLLPTLAAVRAAIWYLLANKEDACDGGQLSDG